MNEHGPGRCFDEISLAKRGENESVGSESLSNILSASSGRDVRAVFNFVFRALGMEIHRISHDEIWQKI